MDFKAVRRGKFMQLATPDGGPVEVKLFGCVVVSSKYSSGKDSSGKDSSGKDYAKLDLSAAQGREDLVRVAEFIDATKPKPRFSPLRFGLGNVVVKFGPGTKWETAIAAISEFYLEPGSLVDVVVSPGAFGDFGWCVNVKRIKKTALSA